MVDLHIYLFVFLLVVYVCFLAIFTFAVLKKELGAWCLLGQVPLLNYFPHSLGLPGSPHLPRIQRGVPT